MPDLLLNPKDIFLALRRGGAIPSAHISKTRKTALGRGKYRNSPGGSVDLGDYRCDVWPEEKSPVSRIVAQFSPAHHGEMQSSKVDEEIMERSEPFDTI